MIILLAEEVLASGDWHDDPLWTHGVSIGVGAEVLGNEILALDNARKAEGLGVSVTTT